jgi:hypothetical protein
MATIKDVAALAGATPTTLSNVLRVCGRIGEETRDRVLAIVDREGYRPNLDARALVEVRAATLALTLSRTTNPIYPEFGPPRAPHRAALEHGRILLALQHRPRSRWRQAASQPGERLALRRRPGGDQGRPGSGQANRPGYRRRAPAGAGS